MANTRDTKPLTVTVDRALEITGLGRTKLYELVKTKQIVTPTIGRRRLIRYASLEALLEQQTAA